MKNRKINRPWWQRWRAPLGVALLAATLVSCGGGGGGDGGVVGTGIQLRGTTSDQRLYASNSIEYKRASGETGAASFGSNGRYSVADIAGEGPLLMRADLGNNDYLYSLGFPNADRVVQQNLHDYTDLIIRNWFASEGLDIDSAFEAAGALDNLPSAADLNDISSTVLAIVADVLADYGVAGVDPLTADYTAGSGGLFNFLNANPVLINNGTINIFVTDPDSDTQGVASSDIPLSNDLGEVDTAPPSIPEDFRAFANASDVILVWSPSTDNVGVSTYQVLRDGVMLDSTPYPVFVDSTLTADTAASYSIIAVDAAGNESGESVALSVTNTTDPDTTAPPAPQSLALASTTASVQLNWSQSAISDVTFFNVYKGSGGSAPTLLARVSATFLTDADVQAGSEYCYRVTAVDAAGNESESTTVSCTTTSGNVVVTAPPGSGGNGAPTAVAFTTESFQVVEDASTAIITVARTGSSNGAVSVDYALTSGTAMAGEDFTATSGTLNWADGDTGNKTISVQIAADSIAETDETFTVTLSNVSGNADIGTTSATVTISNRDAVACSTELEPTSITINTVLDLPCYIVASNINVSDGVNLTIEPGTRLEFEAGHGISVSGSLTAVGTASDPIVFTGRENTAGYWSGIEFYFTNSTANALEHVIVESAGDSNNDDTLVNVRSSGSSISRVRMDSVTLRNSLGDGFKIGGAAIVTSFTNNVSIGNQRAGVVHADVAGFIDDSNAFVGNTEDVLMIDSGNLSRDSRLYDIGVDWLIDDLIRVYDGSTLTVDPGARLLFTPGNGIEVGTDGNLIAIGTADAPISMRGESPAPGRWLGIEYYFRVGIDNRLEHVTIEHAGAAVNNSSALYIRSSESSPATVGLVNVTISESAGTGISAGPGTEFSAFDNVTVTNSGSGAILHPNLVTQLGSGNRFAGNTESVLALTSGNIDTTSTWQALDVPYLVEDINVNAALTLQPGVAVMANSGANIVVGTNGSLNAVGTMANPIVFTGAVEQAGYWEGIEYYFSPSVLNVLDYVTVAYGGGGNAPAAVYMRCSSGSAGQLTHTNSSVTNSAKIGVRVSNSAANGCSYNASNVSYSGNTGVDFEQP